MPRYSPPMHFLCTLAATAAVVAIALMAGAGILHLVARFGKRFTSLSDALCRAPYLDLIVTYFTVLPLILGSAIRGWAGLLGASVGQVLSLVIWARLHEWSNSKATRGPRIVKILNRLVGPWRNHAALWTTVIVSPLFWLIRAAEIAIYPLLRLLVGFPKYNQGEWVNVSRQKFAGLVGHDLIWCLYCDWMTGLWSLGTEILRNVESFWCPIRFANQAKCKNCTVDFPDIDGGWVDASATMQQVENVLLTMHSKGFHGWFGHPVRLTLNGHAIAIGPEQSNGDLPGIGPIAVDEPVRST